MLSAKQKKEEKNRKLEDHVFNVATELIEEVGYENISVREICAAAEISTGMFYRHFDSKDDLFGFYYDRAVEEFYDSVVGRLEGKPLDEQLIQFEVWLCDFTQDCGLDFNRNLYASKNKLMNTDLVHNRMIDITDGFLEEAISKGFTLSPGRTAHAVSKDLCLITKGVIFDWCAHEGNYDMGEREEDLLRRIIGSLL